MAQSIVIAAEEEAKRLEAEEQGLAYSLSVVLSRFALTSGYIVYPLDPKTKGVRSFVRSASVHSTMFCKFCNRRFGRWLNVLDSISKHPTVPFLDPTTRPPI